MSQHTPGPWRPVPYSGVVGAGVMAQPDKAKNSMLLATVNGRSALEAGANARLIARAPDLKDGLTDAVDRLEKILARIQKGVQDRGYEHEHLEELAGPVENLLDDLRDDRVIEQGGIP